jgi:EXLDI family protein
VVPNKTIYVSDDDLLLYRRAQELAGGNLSAAIATALRRYIDAEEGRQEGYDEIVVRVGRGVGRKQRFSGVLLAEWGRSTQSRMEVFRIYRTRAGKFAVHTERSPEWKSSSQSDNWLRDLANWRMYLGIGEQSWGFAEGESTLEVADSLAELRDKIPPELYEMVATSADQPPVEDLDI